MVCVSNSGIRQEVWVRDDVSLVGNELIKIQILCVQLALLKDGSFPTWSLVAQMVRSAPAMWETQVRDLGQEGPVEKRMVTQSAILA